MVSADPDKGFCLAGKTELNTWTNIDQAIIIYNQYFRV
jgi:hypothetical protein